MTVRKMISPKMFARAQKKGELMRSELYDVSKFNS